MSNRTFAQLERDLAEYVGAPVGGRGPYLAGLALNDAIDFANMRQLWFMETHRNITLVSGTRSYTQSAASPAFNTHIVTTILNPSGAGVSRYIVYLPRNQFEIAGFESNINQGPPSFLTYDEINNAIVFDRDPGSGFNGRIVRMLYYGKIPRLVSASDTMGIVDEGEQFIFQTAIWRLRRLARMDYAADKAIADETERRILAHPRSVDVLSLGVNRW